MQRRAVVKIVSIRNVYGHPRGEEERMTLFHFINCVALTYSPLIITYRCTSSVDIGALWRCLRSGGAYFVTQLVKMMLLATFFPLNEFDDDNNFLMEYVKCSVDVIDFLGLYIVITKLLTKSDRKILITALGWGTAQSISTRILPLWFGARGTEFDWKYVQSSLNANIDLVFLFTTCTYLWLLNRSDISNTILVLLVSLLGLLCYKPLLINVLTTLVDPWILLLMKGALATGVGLIALIISSNFTK